MDDPDDHHDSGPLGAYGDDRLDVPSRPCSCCGKPFRPTRRRRRLCGQCYADSSRHEHHHRLALGE